MPTPEILQSTDEKDWSWVLSILESRGFPTPKLSQSTLLISERQGFLLGNLTQKDMAFLSYLYVESDSRRKGIGSALITSFVDIAREHHVKQIVISGFTGNAPGYLQPGVNLETEKDALQLFHNHGFKDLDNAYSMEQMLPDHIELPVNEEWEICHPNLDDVGPLIDAISHSVPGEWTTIFKERFDLNPQQILIARNKDLIGAYSTWQDSRFGPIGVRPECRGQGLGQLLLAHTLENMRQQGASQARFSWSDRENLKFYQSSGFNITKSFMRLILDL
jgi:GNAT superfamily N-acetyltransferase